MRLIEFVYALRSHDVSVAIALLELVRRADDDGVLDRGWWLAAWSSGLRGTGTNISDAPAAAGSIDERARYLYEHVLTRLRSEGIANGEPEGEAWERVRVRPEVWGPVAVDRTAVIFELNRVVKVLLAESQV